MDHQRDGAVDTLQISIGSFRSIAELELSYPNLLRFGNETVIFRFFVAPELTLQLILATGAVTVPRRVTVPGRG